MLLCMLAGNSVWWPALSMCATAIHIAPATAAARRQCWQLWRLAAARGSVGDCSPSSVNGSRAGGQQARAAAERNDRPPCTVFPLLLGSVVPEHKRDGLSLLARAGA